MTATAEVRPRNLQLHQKMSRQIKGGIFSGLAKGLRSAHMPFRDYIRASWPIVQPTTAFLSNWHIDCIAEHFEAVILGQILRLIVNIYPRVGKSLLFSVLGPTWAWTERPWLEQIFISYSQRLATDFSRDRRTLIESHWYRENWGNMVKLAADQNQKNEFENSSRGGMYATSVGGTLTGKGGDLIVIDDGIDPERAESKTEREAAIRFIKNVVSTRLNDPKRGAIIEVSQRTHKHDISGTLLAQGDYTHLNLPAYAEKKTFIEFPISKRVVTREEGDVLFPSRHSRKEIDSIINGMTPRAANAQILQRPSAEEAATFKRDKWQYYALAPEDQIQSMTVVIQSWDMAFKDSDGSDFVAGGVIGWKAPNWYVFNVLRRRMGFGASKEAVLMMTGAWPKAHRKVIEDKANGPGIIEELKKKIPGIEAYNPTDSKDARAAISAQYQEAGNIFLPNPTLTGCGWVKDFVDEHEAYVPGTDNDHDDQVDMLSQAVIWFLSKGYKRPGLFVDGDDAEDDE